ncbi:SIS domain-containing protein [soil metagenome]
MSVSLPCGGEQIRCLRVALDSLERHAGTIERWGQHLAVALAGGARLLVAGNGGSAAQAQHLAAELVGRYRDDRRPLSALALHGDAPTSTAIVNDYGPDEVFARQVSAHGREGDVLLALSTSGQSSNVVAAAAEARRRGVRSWALTGPAPNSLAMTCDESVIVDSEHTSTIQEVHLVAIHMPCAQLDCSLGVSPRARLEGATEVSG